MLRKGHLHVVATVPGDEVTHAHRSQEPPNPPECRYARRLLDAERPDEAMRMLEGEMEAGNSSAEFQFLLGRTALRLGERAQARRAFRRAIALSREHAGEYRTLVRLLSRRSKSFGATALTSSGAEFQTAPAVAETQRSFGTDVGGPESIVRSGSFSVSTAVDAQRSLDRARRSKSERRKR